MLRLGTEPHHTFINEPFTIILSDAPESNYYAAVNTPDCRIYGTYCIIDLDNIEPFLQYPMVNNEDGTYTTTYTITNFDRYGIFIKKYESQGISAYYFTSEDINREPDSVVIESDINVNIPTGGLLEGCTDNCMAIYDFAIVGPITGTVNILIKCLGTVFLSHGNTSPFYITTGEVSIPIEMETNKLHYMHLLYDLSEEAAELALSWEYTGQTKQIIPASTFLHPSSIGLNTSRGAVWGRGLEQIGETWKPVWGEGTRQMEEECDDGNFISNDGWSDTCTIEEGYACDGGSESGRDTCVRWADQGKVVSEDKRSWESVWGDGVRTTEEECDDGDTDSNDGCSSSWTIEDAYACDRASFTDPDTCQLCTDIGGKPSTDKCSCIAEWGDGFKHSTEQWEDGNINFNDGCSATCTIEEGYEWSGGSVSGTDTCTLWTDGTSPNDDKDSCIVQCGDGLKHGEEIWDDGNTDSTIDGCSSTCTIDDGHICTGGSISSPDTCSLCTGGTSPNDGKDACEPKWGDGLKHPSEEWDDGNRQVDDGCSPSC